MIAFLEVALRLQSAQTLPLDLWRPFPAPGSPDATTRVVQRWSIHQQPPADLHRTRRN